MPRDSADWDRREAARFGGHRRVQDPRIGTTFHMSPRDANKVRRAYGTLPTMSEIAI
jgi:hypothetical protein